MGKKNQSRMRAGVLMGIVVLLSSALLVGACAKAPAPSPTPTPGKPAATPTPAPAPVKPIKLVWASGGYKAPETSDKAVHYIWWMEQVQKRSGGRIVFDEYWGGSLGSQAAELLEIVRSGQADVSSLCPVCGTENFFLYESPLNNMFLVVKSHEEAVRIARILYDEFPVFQEMWAKLNGIALTTHAVGPYGFLTKMPIKTLADLKGKKIWSSGQYKPKMFKAIGVVPVSISSGDKYDAIRSGLLDGDFFYPGGIYTAKLYEVATYYLLADTGAIRATPIFMNLKTYNSLPADLRKIIDDVSRESDDVYLQAHWDTDKKAIAFLKTRLTITKMPREEQQTWFKAYSGTMMLDEWVADMGKWGEGAMARKVADRIIELAAPGWKLPASSWTPQGIPEWALKSPATGQVLKPYTMRDELPELFK